MINDMSTSGHVKYGLKEYVLDTPDDIENLPVSGIPVGSFAFIISTSQVYMLNSKGEWLEV